MVCERMRLLGGVGDLGAIAAMAAPAGGGLDSYLPIPVARAEEKQSESERGGINTVQDVRACTSSIDDVCEAETEGEARRS